MTGYVVEPRCPEYRRWEADALASAWVVARRDDPDVKSVTITGMPVSVWAEFRMGGVKG